MFICARLSTWKTPRESPFAQHRVSLRILARDSGEGKGAANDAA